MDASDFVVVSKAEYEDLKRLAARLQQGASDEYRRQWGQFHKAGRDAFGRQWDVVRPRIVHLVSGGRTTTSKELSTDELAQTARSLSLAPQDD